MFGNKNSKMEKFVEESLKDHEKMVKDILSRIGDSDDKKMFEMVKSAGGMINEAFIMGFMLGRREVMEQTLKKLNSLRNKK